MKPAPLRDYEAALIDKAKAQLPRKEDGSFIEEDLVAQVAALVPFDIEQERLRKARQIVDRAKRPGSSRADGQLMLPGLNEPYDYEPERLLSDDEGNIIENHRARPKFKSAEARRAQENAERAFHWWRLKSAESDAFQAWALDQALAGRPALWGICVAENNFRRRDEAAA